MRALSLALLVPLAGCLSLDGFMFNPQKIVPPDDYTFISPEDVPAPVSPDCTPENHSLLEFNAEDGTKLFAVFLPGARGLNGPSILYFHGNDANIDKFYTRIQHLCSLGYNSMMLDYRGYGRSEGTPSEEGLYQDGRAALQQLLARPEVNPESVVFYGMSLGSAVATELAFEAARGELPNGFQPRAILLDSPFASVQAIVDSSTFVHTPVGNLANVRFDNLAKIDQLGGTPVLIMHGELDSFIPIRFGEALFAQAQEPKRFVEFAGSDHVDLEFTDVALFDTSLQGFLDEFVLLPKPLP
jgi:hypothetical protein